MKDIFFSIDQQLADKLVEGLDTPLVINIKNDKYFLTELPPFNDDNPNDRNSIEADLLGLSLKALEYAETREDDLKEFVPEDEELFYLAQNVVNAYLEENPNESDGENSLLEAYDFKTSFGLWKKIKKHAKKAWNWIKKQAKKILQVIKLELEEFSTILLDKPKIVLAKTVRIDNVNLKIKYKVRVHYKIFGRPGSIAFADDFKLLDNDLDIAFKVDGLKYFAEPKFRNLNLVKYILGFKVTIPLAWLVNMIIKPMQIFDASKYLPEIPWFGKSFVVEPPLGLSEYKTGIEFGVSFKLKS
jgi:hypothetical protein